MGCERPEAGSVSLPSLFPFILSSLPSHSGRSAGPAPQVVADTSREARGRRVQLGKQLRNAVGVIAFAEGDEAFDDEEMRFGAGEHGLGFSEQGEATFRETGPPSPLTGRCRLQAVLSSGAFGCAAAGSPAWVLRRSPTTATWPATPASRPPSRAARANSTVGTRRAPASKTTPTGCESRQRPQARTKLRRSGRQPAARGPAVRTQIGRRRAVAWPAVRTQVAEPLGMTLARVLRIAVTKPAAKTVRPVSVVIRPLWSACHPQCSRVS